jgi:hypothetical protein
MSKRGDEARQVVGNTIVAAFGDNFVDVRDKKIYVNMKEGGETIQFAISITMPKTPIATEMPTGEPAAASPIELSPEDKAKIAELKERLGIKD